MTRLLASCMAIAACSDPPELGELEHHISGPVIAEVTTSDGFTQICHGCTAELVIDGSSLGATEQVVLRTVNAFEPIPTTILQVMDHRVRAKVGIPHGFVIDFLDVEVSGPTGAASEPAAIEVTPLVISATATPDGNGTYQSPVRLCGGDIERARANDVVVIRAGEHRCDRVLRLAMETSIFGDGSGVTRIVGTGRGTGFVVAPADQPFDVMSINGLAFAGAIDGASITADVGQLFIFDIADVGGIRVVNGSRFFAEDYRFTGPGRALAIESRGNVTIMNSSISDCTEAISVDVRRSANPARAFLQIESTRIERCDLGVRIGSRAVPATGLHDIEAFLQEVQLIDNTTAVRILDGGVLMFLSNIRDDESTPRTGESGIVIENGSLSFSSGEVSGHAKIGIDVDTSSPGEHSNVILAQASIVGGRVGLRVHGFDRNTNVFVNGVTVRDQTESALRLEGPETLLRLGDVGPLGNSLSVVSGFALDDRRTGVGRFTERLFAIGLVLNGTTYSNRLLQGPLEVGTDLRITSADASWQF